MADESLSSRVIKVIVILLGLLVIALVWAVAVGD